MTFCERCQMTNCEHTTGAGRRYDESTRTARPVPASYSGGPGPTIQARFGGHCASCGRRYDEGVEIRHDPDAGGWISLECCG